jgi:hypothetical protein
MPAAVTTKKQEGGEEAQPSAYAKGCKGKEKR